MLGCRRAYVGYTPIESATAPLTLGPPDTPFSQNHIVKVAVNVNYPKNMVLMWAILGTPEGDLK